MDKIGFFPLLLLLQAVTCLRHFHNGRPKDGFLGVPNVRFDGDLPKDQWITQKLDHFNDADLRTWEQVRSSPVLYSISMVLLWVRVGGETFSR